VKETVNTLVMLICISVN